MQKKLKKLEICISELNEIYALRDTYQRESAILKT